MAIKPSKKLVLKNLIRDRPLIIAGPCSAETKDQIIRTAAELKSLNINVFRAGTWKPRSRVYSFHGLGEKALVWLEEVKERLDMLTATEIASPSHIEMALKHGIDILWIGARSTANPFTVMEIAKALEGVDTPLLVKNPINPDLELWIGAIERLNQFGHTNVGVIHRGFSCYGKGRFRNPPLWELAIEFKRLFPGMPMFCDPSHICGDKEYIFDISQKALDLDYDGLMIETHFDPGHALSDSAQQITPLELNSLLSRLNVSRSESQNHGFNTVLEELRKHIDHIDDEVFSLLSKRMKLSRRIGEIKKEANISVLQIHRWNSILRKRLETGAKNGLSESFIRNILQMIHEESIKVQRDILSC